MSQMIPWLVFCALFLLLCIVLPKAARIFIGVFFILMAVGVNWILSITAPDLFVALGTSDAILPVYAWFFESVVSLAPQIVGIVAGIGEIVVGVLILARGRYVTWGLALGIAFLVLITPLGIWTLPNVVMAAGMGLLMTRTYERSLVDMLTRRRPQHTQSALD